MAGLIISKLLTDFFNEIGQKRTHVAQQNSPLTRPAKSFAGLRDD
jgi:hypothetical protein